MFSGIKSIIFGYSEPATDNGAPTDTTTTSNIATDVDTTAATTTTTTTTTTNAIQETKDDDLSNVLSKQTESSDANDSSDITDMDESWYVIPPPCFTGANKLNDETVKPKPKEADRENALIEHPSMYIASTSNRDIIEQKKNKLRECNKPTIQLNANRTKFIETNFTSKQKTIATKKVNKQQVVPGVAGGALSPGLGKKKTVSITVPSPSSSFNEKTKKSTKAWDKKLNWINDKEDALIEHPSIYIASTSNRDLIEQQRLETHQPTFILTSSGKSIENNLCKQKVSVNKKVNKQQVISVAEQPLSPNLNKRKTVSVKVPSSYEKKNAKVWNKKLNWIHDEEDELDDFDSMFSASTANRDLIENKQKEPILTVRNKPPETVLIEQQKVIAPKKVSKQVTKNNDQLLSSDRNKRKSAPISAQTNEKKNVKAWENKFIVTNWSDDDQDDLNDFENLFDNDDLVQMPPKAKKPKAKKQRAKKKPIDVESGDSFENMSTDISASSSPPTTASVKDEQCIKAISDMIKGYISSIGCSSPDEAEENTKAVGRRQSKALQTERKAPIPVRPIEPERQPSWLVKKARSRRRPMRTIVMNNICRNSPMADSRQVLFDRPMVALRKVKSSNEAPNRSGANKGSPVAAAAAVVSPRSSIAVNLNNLTYGFPQQQQQQQANAVMEETEKLNQSVVRKANVDFNQASRRRLSKNYLDRQNNCAKLANTNRRADRRSRMHITPNGISVNRKVQTNFH